MPKKPASRRRKLLFRSILVILNLYCLLVIVDGFLYWTRTEEVGGKPIGLHTQFLHPYYFFSTPRDQKTVDIVNANEGSGGIWIDTRGYGGGLGPEYRGKRKLAFLLGGSTAFGIGADSPDETIAANLNRIQSEYFFVNAAVSSWNSFQELLRLLKEVLPQKPDLVVSITGINDLALALWRMNSDLPADAPESFEDLDQWVANIRSPEYRSAAARTYLLRDSVFSIFIGGNIRRLLHNEDTIAETTSREPAKRPVEDAREMTRQTAARFFQNIDLSKKVCDAEGITYVVILQPHIALHPLRAAYGVDPLAVEYKAFCSMLLSKRLDYIHDGTVPFPDIDASEFGAVYSDAVHLTSRGYAEYAKDVLEAIRAHD